jgi:acyl-CoA synthetase (AMP-forming)/AMP-acid ligase II
LNDELRPAGTLVDLLRSRATAHGARPAFGYLDRGERLVDETTYAELDSAARSVAGHLLDRGAGGKPVLVALPPGLDFVRTFVGCLYAGAFAVPVPQLLQRQTYDRVRTIAADARPAALLVHRDAAGARQNGIVDALPNGAGALVLAEEALAARPIAHVPAAAPDGLAFIQYTSGSTRKPKGVAVTHRNLMASQAMIAAAFGHGEHDIGVSWLPHHHDMGLIGAVLQPLYMGCRSLLMSPLAFVQKPLRWLRAIATYRGTSVAAPNFGYELCTRAVSDEDAAALDLSCLRVASTGAEPIRVSTLDRFAAKFAASRLAPGALLACYGLAEATLLVSAGVPGSGIRRRYFTASGRDIVSCGFPSCGSEVVLLRPGETSRVPTESYGEICVRGEHVSPGYWHGEHSELVPDTANRVTLDGATFLRTGDLGALVDGELYVVGRLKDMLIVHGENHYAEEIEETLSEMPETAPLATSVAFSVDSGEAEALIVVCEVAWRAFPLADADEIASHVRTRVGQVHGIVPRDVRFVPYGTVPRTSSGKVRRSALRELYLQGLPQADRGD